MMSEVPIRDIIISARLESHRMRHHYLGIEHLFIALLEMKGGLTGSIIADEGFAPEYVIDAIRRKAGKGGRQQLLANFPNSPRTEVILGIAGEIALEQGRQDQIRERDILIAILEENDSIPTRVLAALGISIEHLQEQARTRQVSRTATQSFVKITFSMAFDGELSHDHLFILRRMFHGYAEIRVDTRLTGGYTRAVLLVVTPVHVDRRVDASVVVKIGPADMILDEARRYDQYVKNTLPPLTARLEERPTSPDTSDLAGIKYTFVTDSDGNPRDMRAVVRSWSGSKMGEWLVRRLYDNFGEVWWKQNRPYRFEAWQEYDWMLPPVLTLELVDEEAVASEQVRKLRFPLRRSRLSTLEFGDYVGIENFIVQKVDRDRQSISLALGQGTNVNRAYQIEVRGIDFEQDMYFRGEIVEHITGRIWKTRSEQLSNAVRALQPDFDIREEYILINDDRLENPLFFYQKLLDETIEGSLSTIHGDLHPGNILIGPNDTALLIDFARTRDGHTIFDWANLEVSLLNEMIMPLVTGEDWDSVRQILTYLMTINHPDRMLNAPPELKDALRAINSLRQVVTELLANPNNMSEYYLAVAMCSLRAVTWETMSIASRRLMYLVAGLMIHEFMRLQHPDRPDGTPTTPDATDFMSNTRSDDVDPFSGNVPQD